MFNDYDKTWRVLNIINYILVIVLSLTIILPFINIFALAFNDGQDAARGGVYFFPREFTLENFREVFTQSKILNGFYVSIFRTVVGTFLSVFLTALAAYALKSKTLPFRKIITFFIFFTMLFSGGLIPYYLLLSDLGLTNTIWVYIIPSLYSVWNLMIMRTFFLALPDSVEEAAMIDGCNEFQTFFRIVLPMSKPVIATIALFNAVAHWNDWFSGAFYVRNPDIKPLATILQEMLTTQEALSEALLRGQNYQLVDQISITGDSLRMATIVLVVLPVLIVYPFIQKYFAKGANIGSLKE